MATIRQNPTADGARLIAGAMSGTSADGVDVAVCATRGHGLSLSAELLSHAHEPFSSELRRQVHDVRQRGEARFSDLCAMGHAITQAYARATRAACDRLQMKPAALAAVAAHGQTLYHSPPHTLQWFDPSLLAWELGCPVVSDFRRADCAAGGQGAPLVPLADWVLFRHPTKTRVLLNLGGIANLTYLPAGGGIEDVVAFDTGPGNCVSDWLCREHGVPGGFDEGGRMASVGRPDEDWVRAVMAEPFFSRRPPRSTDGPAMIALFWKHASRYTPMMRARAPRDELYLADLLATGLAVAADAIRSSLVRQKRTQQLEIIVSGGGVANASLIARLRDRLFVVREDGRELGGDSYRTNTLRSIDDLGRRGVRSEAKEALAFAVLGAMTLDGEPGNVVGATGASRRVVLGSVTPRP